MINDRIEFVDFLVKAKKNTYAGDGNKANPSRPGSKDLHFKEGDYLYIDTYLGSFDFIGEETVWKSDVPVWAMNYFGKMTVEKIPAGFIDCLKGALKNIPVHAPFRGPETYYMEGFKYTCEWEGDIGWFKGVEQIELNQKQIYSLIFHGGMIK